MSLNKFRAICRWVRISLGLGLLITGIVLWNPWFLLGVIPLVAGTINFCPACLITKKCDI